MKAFKRFVVCVAFCVLAGGLALAQGPSPAEKVSSRLPEGTIGFIATSGMEQLKPAFDQSSLGQIWNHPGVQAFYVQTRDAIVARIQQEIDKSGDPGAKEVLSLLPTLAAEILQCPIAVGIVDIPAQKVNHLPFGVMAVVEAGKRKEKIQPLIDQIEQKIGKDQILDKKMGDTVLRTPKDSADLAVFWGWYRDSFVILVNNESGDWLAGLANPSGRTNLLAGLPAHGDLLAVYCDVQKAGAVVSRSMDTEGDKQSIDKLRKIFDALGLKNVQSISARVGFSGKDVVVDEWVKVPAPHTGIWTAIKPIDRKLLARTDARSMTTAAWNIDAAILYDVILKAVTDAMDSDQQRQDIQKGIAEFETEAGIKIRQGLLASIDGPVVLQAYPSMVITEVPAGGYALVAGLKDPALFEQQIKVLTDKVGKELKPDVLQIRSGKLEGGQTQTFLISPMLSLLQIVPNWIIADNRLILTTNPTLTTILLKQYAGDKPAVASLGDDKDFQAAAAKLPANTAVLEYSDVAVNAGQFYQQAQQFWPTIMGLASGQGLVLPVSLPDLGDILKGLGKSVYYGYLDKDGFRTHYQGCGVEISSVGAVSAGAVVAAIALPAMAKAKDQAQAVVSMNNLKQIGVACLVYAHDHQANFPPNLDTLVKDGKLTDKVLQSPRKPKGFSGPSYIYVEGHKTSSTNPTESIVAYEDPSLAKDGKIAVLFLDAHCEIVDLGRFQDLLKKTYEGLGRPMPDNSKPAGEPSGKPEPKKKPADPDKTAI